MRVPDTADPARIYRVHSGIGPLVAVALHDGHAVRPALLESMVLSEAERLREEDPFTGLWTTVAPTRVIATHSRFQVELNRPRETCIYREPEDCWGLELYSTQPSAEELERSVAEYDHFYGGMHELLTDLTQAHKRVVVYDLHSYNHRRHGPDGPVADPEMNPQVNVGTGTMDRDRWGHVVDAFNDSLRAADFPDCKLDVRENVKFQGGNLARWVHEKFPDSVVVIAIEFKKFFMDEWSGAPDQKLLSAITLALQSTVQPVLTALAATQDQVDTGD